MENTLFIAAKFHTTRNKKRGFKQMNSSPETNISKQYKSKDEVPETTWNWI
jgi:hypothetical protein